MKITKKVTGSGGITLPREIRTELGIPAGSAVDITTDEERIIISKHVPLCSFCGSPENVVRVLKTEICRKCAETISRKAGITNG